MPDRASCRLAVTSCALLPIEETMPRPVTATRLMGGPFQLVLPHAQAGATAGPPGEQADAQIFRLVDGLAVDLHDPVADAEHQLAHDCALRSMMGDQLGIGQPCR